MIKDKGGIRHQFHHVIDIVPTILEATGIPAPAVVDGIAQSPIEGVSMAYTFDAANADAPSTHQTQYFEMFGNRAHLPRRLDRLHQGDAPAVGARRHGQPDRLELPVGALRPRRRTGRRPTTSPRSNPEKLKEMQELFWQEAAKYQVLPLDDSVATRLVTPRPEHHRRAATRSPGRGRSPAPRTATRRACSTRSYTITAEVEVPEGGGEGMLITQGGRFGGYGFYLLKGKPVFLWNLVDLERVTLGGRGRADARQAHAGVRLQLRRARRGHARLQQHERHRPAAAPAC